MGRKHVMLSDKSSNKKLSNRDIGTEKRKKRIECGKKSDVTNSIMHTANSASFRECVDMPPVLFRLLRLCNRSARNDSCSSLSRLDRLTLHTTIYLHTKFDAFWGRFFFLVGGHHINADRQNIKYTHKHNCFFLFRLYTVKLQSKCVVNGFLTTDRGGKKRERKKNIQNLLNIYSGIEWVFFLCFSFGYYLLETQNLQWMFRDMVQMKRFRISVESLCRYCPCCLILYVSMAVCDRMQSVDPLSDFSSMKQMEMQTLLFNSNEMCIFCSISLVDG